MVQINDVNGILSILISIAFCGLFFLLSLRPYPLTSAYNTGTNSALIDGSCSLSQVLGAAIHDTDAYTVLTSWNITSLAGADLWLPVTNPVQTKTADCGEWLAHSESKSVGKSQHGLQGDLVSPNRGYVQCFEVVAYDPAVPNHRVFGAVNSEVAVFTLIETWKANTNDTASLDLKSMIVIKLSIISGVGNPLVLSGTIDLLPNLVKVTTTITYNCLATIPLTSWESDRILNVAVLLISALMLCLQIHHMRVKGRDSKVADD